MGSDQSQDPYLCIHHQENLKNPKSSKGKNLYEKIIFKLLLNIAKRQRRSGEHCSGNKYTKHLRDICFTLGNRYSRVTAGTLVSCTKPKCDVPRENLPWEMPFTVLCVTAPIVFFQEPKRNIFFLLVGLKWKNSY